MITSSSIPRNGAVSHVTDQEVPECVGTASPACEPPKIKKTPPTQGIKSSDKIVHREIGSNISQIIQVELPPDDGSGFKGVPLSSWQEVNSGIKQSLHGRRNWNHTQVLGRLPPAIPLVKVPIVDQDRKHFLEE